MKHEHVLDRYSLYMHPLSLMNEFTCAQKYGIFVSLWPSCWACVRSTHLWLWEWLNKSLQNVNTLLQPQRSHHSWRHSLKEFRDERGSPMDVCLLENRFNEAYSEVRQDIWRIFLLYIFLLGPKDFLGRIFSRPQGWLRPAHQWNSLSRKVRRAPSWNAFVKSIRNHGAL